MKSLRLAVVAAALLLPSLASAQQAGPYFRLRLQSSGFTPPTGYLNVYAKTSNKHLYSKDADGNEVDLTGGGSGTVTSVGMTVPSFLSVAGSPVTTSGTLAVTLATQAANLVMAGPTTGAAAAPTFRALVAADLPNTAVSAGTCTACDLTIDAQGRITAKASGAAGGGTTQTIDTINASATTGKTITAAVANSGTNVGFILNNSTTLSGTTLLLSLRNNGTEKFAVEDDGTVVAQHFSGTGSAPSCTPGAAMGTGGSVGCTCAGTDAAMECTFVMGASGVGSGTWATITFAGTYGTKPFCSWAPGTAATATSAVGYTIAVNRASSSAADVVVESGATTSAGATYYGVIHCTR